jgi:hypothetical protein
MAGLVCTSLFSFQIFQELKAEQDLSKGEVEIKTVLNYFTILLTCSSS